MKIASLDGIRAISILIVFFSHAGLSNLLPGGFGVTVFFFLSGFLISTLLFREWDRWGTISLKAFYLRRLLRLTPPLLLTLAAGVAMVALGWLENPVHWPTIASQIFFYFNIYFLLGLADPIPGTGVFWSLSIEEHFYFIWPILLIFLNRKKLSSNYVIAILVLILAWRSFRFFILGATEDEIYYGTDTRLDSLLFGCLLAMWIWQDTATRLFPQGKTGYVVISAALIGLITSFLIRSPEFRATFRYSLQGLCLLPLFYYAVSRPDWVIFKPLEWRIFRIIGLYSYTIYLVHFILIKAFVNIGLASHGTWSLAALAGIGSVMFAAAVYQFAERPLHPWRKSMTGHNSR